jgi:hypothetical protein
MLRVIWQFSRDRVELEDLTSGSFSASERLGLSENVSVCPVFRQEDVEIATESLETLGDPEDDLARYFHALVRSEDELRPILNSLDEARRAGLIRWSDIQADIGSGQPIPEDTEDDPLKFPFDPGPGPSLAWDRFQYYLGPADSQSTPAVGVDARFLWSIRGGRGEKIRIVDIEKRWNLQHESLQGQDILTFREPFGGPGNSEDKAHGTAVLGILCATPLGSPNSRGVIGIAHRADVGIASFQGGSRDLNPEGVIRDTLRWLSAGDVILLELEATRPKVTPAPNLNLSPFLPLEAWAHSRAAFRLAALKGVYVVEAAGNGGLSLNRREHGVRRSGPALMVGAGHYRTGETMFFSNRGPRVDLQGWGLDVVTAGAAADKFNDLQARVDTNRCYTAQFSGTSSAAAIVAGCVAAISGVVKAHGFDPLTPDEMKDLLQGTGSFGSRDQNGGIGPLPDLRAALKALEERFQQEDRSFKGFECVQERALRRASGIWGFHTSSPVNQYSRSNEMAKQRSSPPSKDQIEQAYRKALKTYGSRENVTGIDKGYKYVNGQRIDQMAIRIHVREKLDDSVLEAAEVFPSSIQGVPVDVIQAVYRPQADLAGNAQRTQRLDPIQPGISCGHRSVTAGTLGAMVFDRVSGRKAILSNWHVLAGSPAAQAGDAILQPGRADGGRFPGDSVASLERWILNAHGDAAVALLNDSRSFIDEPLGSGADLGAPRMVNPGEIVQKSGRTTGVTEGRVDGTGRYFIDYDGRKIGIDGFKVVAVKDGNPDDEEISSGGDSGSIWYVEGSREAVGLHFAGETDPQPDQEHALACHLPRVLEALNVSLGSVEKKQAVVTKRQTQKSGNGHNHELVNYVQKHRDSLMGLLKLLENGNSVPAVEETSAEDSHNVGGPY